jgi:lipopolysaccharide export system ATP-binding protein
MALMYNPKILLCDEIFAALDVLTIQMLCKLLIDLQRENSKMCILICEHQARELLSIVDRALILSNGKIIAEGSPNQILNDKNARSKYFGSFTR